MRRYHNLTCPGSSSRSSPASCRENPTSPAQWVQKAWFGYRKRKRHKHKFSRPVQSTVAMIVHYLGFRQAMERPQREKCVFYKTKSQTLKLLLQIASKSQLLVRVIISSALCCLTYFSVFPCFTKLTVLYFREFPLWSTHKTETTTLFSKQLKEKCLR